MAVLPDFLIKRIYKKGSLRFNSGAIEFDLKNVLGPGAICGFEYVQINGHKFSKEVTYFITQNIKQLANCVSEINPIHFRLGQECTFRLEEGINCIKEGLNKIEIELSNPEAGKLKVIFEDNL